MPRKSRLDKPLEWYPWSPLQWQSSRRVQRLTWAQKGLYRELLDECYLKGSLPADPEGIADLLGEDLSNIGHDLVPVLRCFTLTEDGRLTNPTIERVRAEQMEVRLARITRRKGRESDPEDPENRENGTTNVVHGATGTTNVVSVTTGTTRTGQDRTGQDIKETTTPQPPQAGERKRKRRTQGQIISDLEDLGVSPEAIAAGKEILEFWPKKDGPDHRDVNTEIDQLIPRLDDLHKRNPALSFAIMVAGGRLYCDSKRKRYKAAQHFYTLTPDPDTGEPPFREWCKAAYAKEQIAKRQADLTSHPPITESVQ